MRKPRRSRGKACALNRIGQCRYDNLANYALALQRFDETRQIIHEAQARKLDDLILHIALYALAFIGGGLRGDGGTAAVVCGQARI